MAFDVGMSVCLSRHLRHAVELTRCREVEWIGGGKLTMEFRVYQTELYYEKGSSSLIFQHKYIFFGSLRSLTTVWLIWSGGWVGLTMIGCYARVCFCCCEVGING